MRFLITLGPTREPIDAVRYIGNRSSGRMGAAIVAAAVERGHEVTVIAGPTSVKLPEIVKRIDVETAAQMHAAVLAEFVHCNILIMAAAVADYRPKQVQSGKLPRVDALTIELEATPDILASVAPLKRRDQRTVGFGLEALGQTQRAREKLVRKQLDMIVYNPLQTMESELIAPMLMWADGRTEPFSPAAKAAFARNLVDRALSLFHN